MIRPSSAGPENVYHANSGNNHASSTKHAHKICQRFKKDYRFTGKLEGKDILPETGSVRQSELQSSQCSNATSL